MIKISYKFIRQSITTAEHVVHNIGSNDLSFYSFAKYKINPTTHAFWPSSSRSMTVSQVTVNWIAKQVSPFRIWLRAVCIVQNRNQFVPKARKHFVQFTICRNFQAINRKSFGMVTGFTECYVISFNNFPIVRYTLYWMNRTLKALCFVFMHFVVGTESSIVCENHRFYD